MAVPAEVWAKKPKKAAKAKTKAAKKAARMEKVGKAAYRQRKYDDAVIAFEAAYEADAQPKFLYNIARCHEKKGELAKAAEFYDRYLTEAPDAEDREEVATQAEFLTKKLKKTMAKLVVTSVPSGAGLRVQGEGEKLDVKTPWSGWLAPGRYEISILLTGHQEHTQKLALAAGDQQKVQAELKAEGGEEAVAAAAVEEPDAAPEPKGALPEPVAEAPTEGAEPEAPGSEEADPAHEGLVTAPPPAGLQENEAGGVGVMPLAAFGLGAAALISWGVFGGLAMAGQGNVDDGVSNPGGAGRTRTEMQELADSTNLYGAVANISLAVAAAAGLTGGAILLLSGDGEQTTAAARWTW